MKQQHGMPKKGKTIRNRPNMPPKGKTIHNKSNMPKGNSGGKKGSY